MTPTGLHPLRTGQTDVNPLNSPEALLISAMLELGQFNPASYHVTDEDIDAWKKLWLFGVEYQQRAGEAPPLSLIRKQFPDFDLTTDISPKWAASKVQEAASARLLRHRSKAMLIALADEDIEGAFTALEGLQRPHSHRKQPDNIFDHEVLTDAFSIIKMDVPYPTLMRATRGGIAPGELWYLAARLGQGKTWEILGYAAHAAKCGYKVAVLSLEMPSQQVAKRALLRLAGRDTPLAALLESDNLAERMVAVDTIQARTLGSIKIIDPSHGVVNTTNCVKELCQEYDLVVVDHAGLLMTSDGRRAIDDWRAMAMISNILREITLATGTPILAAAQINREGEGRNSTAPPKVSNLSQSDALGQDADVVITMKRLSERVMIHSAEKVRNGPNLRWYTRFDPEKNRFEEITQEAALELGAMDDDRQAR